MSEILIACIVLGCLLAASLGAAFLYPARLRDDETNATVRNLAGLFVVMTSLVFGLMINSAKNTYEGIDANVHAFATNLIVLDRSLRTYGLLGNEARAKLLAYVEAAIAHPARADYPSTDQTDSAGQALNGLQEALASIQPADSYHETLLADMRQQYRRLVEQRWAIIEQSEGTIPKPLVAMLVAWMTLIFGSFGLHAPRNGVVVGSFILSAFLIAGAFYLILDMDVPFAGLIQIPDLPLRRALAEIQT